MPHPNPIPQSSLLGSYGKEKNKTQRISFLFINFKFTYKSYPSSREQLNGIWKNIFTHHSIFLLFLHARRETSSSPSNDSTTELSKIFPIVDIGYKLDPSLFIFGGGGGVCRGVGYLASFT